MNELDRKTRFWIDFPLAILIYSLPIVGCAYAGLFWYLTFFVGAFVISVYLIYRFTIRNIRLQYPVVNPEGHPDIYSGRMPRPIYEDVQRYPSILQQETPKKTRQPEKNLEKTIISFDWSVPIDSRTHAGRANL